MPEPIKKFSFAKAGAATPTTPVETPPAPTQGGQSSGAPEGTTAGAPAGTGASNDTPQNLPAVPPKYAPPAFYTGDEDEPFDPADQRMPRINIVQKSSSSEWLKHGVGSLLLKGEVKIPLPARIVVIGARPKVWIEKTPYVPGGGGPKARVAHSIDEVAKFGGTDQWKFSKESNARNGTTFEKPWFMPSVTLAILIEKPEGLAPELEDHFGYEANGKYYAAGLLSVKSTNYEAVWIFISSERRGVLSEGFNSHFIKADVKMVPFKGGESGVFKLAFAEKTSPELRALATKIATGS